MEKKYQFLIRDVYTVNLHSIKGKAVKRDTRNLNLRKIRERFRS